MAAAAPPWPPPLHPAENTGASRPPTPTPPFYLQVGAFQNRDNAERLRLRVSDATRSSVRMREIASNGQRIYRVQVGPFVNVEASDRIVQLLTSMGLEAPRVVLD
jgi:rare lipoprotein A